jgi:hypothetical protein
MYNSINVNYLENVISNFTMQPCDYNKIIQLVKQTNNVQTFLNETFRNFKNVLETKHPELFNTFTQLFNTYYFK